MLHRCYGDVDYNGAEHERKRLSVKGPIERDAMWKDELRKRDAAYWEDSNNKEVDLVRMLETRDKGIQDSLVSRDKAWMNSLHSCSESLRLMTQEQINIRATLESVGKRQYELTKGNAQILD